MRLNSVHNKTNYFRGWNYREFLGFRNTPSVNKKSVGPPLESEKLCVRDYYVDFKTRF